MNAFIYSATLINSKRNERGATATEYALLVGGIALVIVLAVAAFGGDLSTWFEGLFAQLGLAEAPVAP